MLKILDLGTGTGCLLLALLSELPRRRRPGNRYPARRRGYRPGQCRSARSRRPGALQNRRLGAGNRPSDSTSFSAIRLMCRQRRSPDWSRRSPASIPGWRSRAGSDGLNAYRALALQLPDLLAGEGRAFIELGFGQAAAAAGLFEAGGLQACGLPIRPRGHSPLSRPRPAKKSWKSPCDRLG